MVDLTIIIPIAGVAALGTAGYLTWSVLRLPSGDEKMREKTRKALAIALQLLEDRPAQLAASDDQPRRE